MSSNVSLSRRKGVRFGFTLIELLVVISIIALLMAVLVPSLNKARDMAKRAICSSNLKNVMIAAMAYSNDHNYSFPGNEFTAYSGDIPDWNVSSRTTWAKGLYPYLFETWRVYACPAAPEYKHPAWGLPLETQITQARPGTSYRITSFCNLRKQSEIRQPATVVMFWESGESKIWSSRYPNGIPPGGDWTLIGHPGMHSSKPNFLFADGHVRSCTEEEIWKPEYFWPEYAK